MGLPVEKHQRFRRQLKLQGKGVFAHFIFTASQGMRARALPFGAIVMRADFASLAGGCFASLGGGGGEPVGMSARFGPFFVG